MFDFIRDYKRGKAYMQALQFAMYGIVCLMGEAYRLHRDGKIFGFAIADCLIGEDAEGKIQEYRLNHTDEIKSEVDRLLTEDEELRKIALLTIFIKAINYRAHGSKEDYDRVLSCGLIKQWGIPRALPDPDEFQGMVESYISKHSQNQDARRQ